MRRKILAILIVATVILAGYAAYLFKTHHVTKADEVWAEEEFDAATGEHKRKISQEYTDVIDMSKWLYNEADDVYYQTGVLYVQRPADEQYERLALFVPGDFLKCRANGPETYSCEPDEKARVGSYTVQTAPIVIPVENPEHGVRALTSYRDVSLHTKAGHVYVHIGFRGYDAGAPLGLVDLKAAIRFLRHNQPHLPASTDLIFMFGVKDGGGLASLVGTTGDSKLFRPYFKDIGAMEYGSDLIYGVMAWNPNIDFDAANEAYEWNMGATRSGLSDGQLKVSQKLAKEYASYVNSAGFRDARGHPLLLQYSDRGIYQEGTYYHHVKEVIEDSLNEFLQTSKYPLQIDESEVPAFMREYAGFYIDKERYLRRLNSQLSWIKYDTVANRYVIRSVEDFVMLLKPATKPVGAFDDPSRKRPENILFGDGTGRGYHFDKYIPKLFKDNNIVRDYAEDLKKQDALGISVQDRLNMFTPLYFIMPSYEGYRTASVAPYWRIRSGISQTDTPLTTEINLAMALANYPTVEKVDFKTVWSKASGMVEETPIDGETAFIRWVDNVLKSE